MSVKVTLFAKPLPYFEGLPPVTKLFYVMQGHHTIEECHDNSKAQRNRGEKRAKGDSLRLRVSWEIYDIRSFDVPMNAIQDQHQSRQDYTSVRRTQQAASELSNRVLAADVIFHVQYYRQIFGDVHPGVPELGEKRFIAGHRVRYGLNEKQSGPVIYKRVNELRSGDDVNVLDSSLEMA